MIRTARLMLGGIPLVCLLVPAAAAPAQTTDLERLMETGRIIASAESTLSVAWPGYWHPGKPFILTIPGDYILIYTTRRAPDGYSAVQNDLGGIGAFYVASGTRPEMAASEGYFDLEYPLSGELATAVPLRSERLQSLEFLFHEAFHAYQDAAFEHRGIAQKGVPTDEVTSPEFRALAEVERRILIRALKDTVRESLEHLILQYLAVRGHRLADVSAHTAAVEADMERTEGSAFLVGYAAALHALARSDDEVARIIQERLARPLEISTLGGSWNIRLRIYGTGAAIGLLLDRLDPAWKPAMEASKDFGMLLRDAVSAPSRINDGVFRSALEEFGYDVIHRRLTESSPSPSAQP